MAVDTTKTCVKCLMSLPLRFFHRTKVNKGGRNNRCWPCRSKAQRHRLYGITPAQYEQRYLEQWGECAICRTHRSELKRDLCVDHDHGNGQVRGLLCDECNRVLGIFRDSPDRLRDAARYLENAKMRPS